jgi:uncharacterized repeat protein (TIGR02543 family)
MHAQWQDDRLPPPTEYTVTFDSHGGSAVADLTENEGTQVEEPATPTKTGYTFQGWFSAETGGTKYPWPHTLNEDLAMHAQWAAITYTVTYNANGGDSGTTASSTHTYDVSAPLTANGFTRTGYDFAGWAASSGGSVSHADGASVKNLSSTNGATVTIYAKWTPVTYDIIYNLNYGTNNAANPASYTIESADIVLKDPSRAGYRFGGWYSDAAFSTKVTTIPMGSTGDKTFYAKWIPGASVQINLQPVLGDPPLSNESVFVDEAAQFSAAGSGYASWVWYWDGTVIGGAVLSDYTLAANSKPAGIYELSVVVTTNTGEKLSARCRVTIKAR